MVNIHLKQVVIVLLLVYLFYRLFIVPFIPFVICIINLIKVREIKKMQNTVIIKITQKKEDKNIYLTIVIFIILLLFELFVFKIELLLQLLALIIFIDICLLLITPIVYNKINGFYEDFFVYNEKINYDKIHSWKRMEESKTISFLFNSGLRYDLSMGDNYNECIRLIIRKNIKEEI
jgi:hypothetical protein